MKKPLKSTISSKNRIDYNQIKESMRRRKKGRKGAVYMTKPQSRP
jgi:hypothetical protein